MRCNRTATFHYKGKLQKVFRAGLNEIKYDYVDSKQHIIYSIMLQQQTWKHFSKNKRPSSNGVPRVYCAWRQAQFKRSQPIRGSIK